MCASELIEEYNAFYRSNPERWNDHRRDAFAFNVLERYFQGEPPSSMLDIGCGNGHTIAYFLERWSEVDYTGLDLSDEATNLAEKRAPEAEFLTGFLRDMGLTGFDLVTLLGVAEHFEDLPAGLADVWETVADDGIVYLEVPNCLGYPLAKPEEGFRAASFGSGQIEWHLKRKTWENRLQEAGFRIVERLKGPQVTCEFVWLLAREEQG